MMVGRHVSFKTEKIPSNPKEVVLSIKDLVVNENRGVPAVKNLSLDVRAGEIIGIAGIDGNGQTELVQAITGLRKVNLVTLLSRVNLLFIRQLVRLQR